MAIHNDQSGSEHHGTFPRLLSWAHAVRTALRGERRDAAENRQRVLAAARELFAAKGLDAVSMHEISRAAGIGQGTLYRRYPHKGALCHALVEDSMQEFHDLEVAQLETEANTMPALAQVGQFLNAVLAFIEENAQLMIAMGDSACGVSSEERFGHPWVVWQRETVLLLLRRAVLNGEISPIDVEATVDLILAVCSPEFYTFERYTRGFSRERIVANLDHLLAALGRDLAAEAVPV